MSYRLPSTARLKSRKSIAHLFEKGKKKTFFPVGLLWAETESIKDASLQIMFSVSKRSFPRAVDRNYLKRRMREGWRLQKGPLEEVLCRQNRTLMVALVYKSQSREGFKMIYDKISLSIQHLIRLNEQA